MQNHPQIFEIFESADDDCKVIYGGEIDLSEIEITVNRNPSNHIDLQVYEVTSTDFNSVEPQYGGEIGPLTSKDLSQASKFKAMTTTSRLVFCGFTFLLCTGLVMLCALGKISHSALAWNVATQVFILAATNTALNDKLDLFRYIKVMIGATGKLLGSKEEFKDMTNDETR